MIFQRNWIHLLSSRKAVAIFLGLGSFALSTLTFVPRSLTQIPPRRNAIIIVADGLRAGSINPTDTPTLYSIRTSGVNFVNSHSIFPTFTTPNASAIATGHYLGDTGDFSNTIYAGAPIPNAGGSVTPFIENDAILADIDERFPGNNFLNEEALLAIARKSNFSTAAVGKLGPTLIQDVTQGNRVNGTVPSPTTIIVDDSTGRTGGVPLRSDIATAIANDTYYSETYVKPGYTTAATITPGRSNGAPACNTPLTNPPTPPNCRDNNGFSGNNTTPGTDKPNTIQQQYFTDVITRTILPTFKNQGNPFVLVYWSRDPDGTQHNQGDSLNSLTPGINGPTAKQSLQNVDQNVKQILTYLKDSGLASTTDVFITADHGFSTISRSVVNNTGTRSASYAATLTYPGVNPGFLPPGFVAIDLANYLSQPLYDPDTPTVALDANNNVTYALVTPTVSSPIAPNIQRPRNGNGIIGGTGKVINGKTDGNVVIAANGGSDLIYLPNGNPTQANGKTLAQNVVTFLTTQDYISGIFADDAFGKIPGALPLSAINLKGSALTPVPAIVINFRSFATDPSDLNSTVELADTGLQQGQGMHGSFSRADTFNNMAAIGPDFKKGFQDTYPISNADVVPTIAKLLNLALPSRGVLTGRVLTEAIVGNSPAPVVLSRTLRSDPASNGLRTLLNYQQLTSPNGVKTLYFDTAGFPGRTSGLKFTR